MNKRVIFIISPGNFRDRELFVPLEELSEAGVETRVASLNTGVFKGADGGRVEAEMKIEELEPDNFDGVVFIGGPGMAEITDDKRLMNLAENFFEAGKLTAAICIAPMVLANAGLLENISATVWPSSSQDLQDKGADYKDKPTVTAGKIITAGGPESAEEFAQAIITYLETNT